MSKALYLKSLTQSEATRLLSDLVITIRDHEKLVLFREREGLLYIPIGYDASWLSSDHFVPLPEYTKHEYKSSKQLYSYESQVASGAKEGQIKDQLEIYEEIKDCNTYLLEGSTGIGKTLIMTHIASYHKAKTWVICPNGQVLDQWAKEFEAAGATVGRIVNPRVNSLPKTTILLSSVEMGRRVTPDQVKDVEVVIYDECHLSTVACLTETLLNVTPRCLYLCSATPKREDAAHRAFPLFHGGRVVSRLLVKHFEMIRCNTLLTPKIRYCRVDGRRGIDYSHAIHSINNLPEFPTLIEKLLRVVVATSSGRTLCFFRENDVLGKVSKLLRDIPHFIANKKVNIRTELKDEALILAIDKKAKEGVDISGIKDVVLTYSTKQIEQPEGRAREDNFRLWFFVHDHSMHVRHWETSKKWASVRSDGKYVEKEIDLCDDINVLTERISGDTEVATSSGV